MRINETDNRGFAAVFICLITPVLLIIVGICIDGGMIMYSDARLMAATKFAAISATAFYSIEDGKAVLKGDSESGPAREAAESVLEANYSRAWLHEFIINSSRRNECTLHAKAKVDFYFVRIFNIKSTTIEEMYTAERVLK